MPKSYRIRTQVGVDKYINVKLDQDFDFLEILSLKINQSDLYTKVCSDYGVVVGRVVVNGGFGLPNAKVSIFIPLTPEDELKIIPHAKILVQKQRNGQFEGSFNLYFDSKGLRYKESP